jgi:tetratricopeptide (TPR) repeat protein/energy-coupling factor transporter ATP-binding protein EcfA2
MSTIPLGIDEKVAGTIREGPAGGQPRIIEVRGCHLVGKTALLTRLSNLHPPLPATWLSVDFQHTWSPEDLERLKSEVHRAKQEKKSLLVLWTHAHAAEFALAGKGLRGRPESAGEAAIRHIRHPFGGRAGIRAGPAMGLNKLEDATPVVREFDLVIQEAEAKRIFLDALQNEGIAKELEKREDQLQVILQHCRFEDPSREYTTYVPPLLAFHAARLRENPGICEAHATGGEGAERVVEGAYATFAKELEEQKQRQLFLLALFGASGATPGVLDAIGQAIGVIPVLAPFVGGTFGLAAPVVVAGLGLGLWAASKRRNPGSVADLVRASEYWHDLGDDVPRQMLAYEIERRQLLPPGSVIPVLERLLGSADDAGYIQRELDGLSADPEFCARFARKLTRGVEAAQLDKLHSELTRDLSELQARISNVEDEVRRLRTEFTDRQKKFEAETNHRLDQLQTPTVAVTPENIDRFRPFASQRRIAPVISEKWRTKKDQIVAELKQNRRVLLTGPPGIGKSTLLYQVCKQLLRDQVPLFTGNLAGLREGQVYFCDDLRPEDRGSGFKEITALPCAVIATGRSSDWDPDSSRGWLSVELTEDDLAPQHLEEILIQALKENQVDSNAEGVRTAVNKSRGVPVYLVELAKFLSQSGKKLDKESANALPESIRRLLLDVLASLPERESRDTISLLFALALTRPPPGRLHDVHLMYLMREFNPGAPQHVPDSFFGLVNRGHSALVYSLSHDLWREVLLNQNGHPEDSRKRRDVLAEVRSRQLVKCALDRSFEESVATGSEASFFKLVPAEAAQAAQVTLENRQDLAPQILRVIESRWPPGSQEVLVIEVVALEDPMGMQIHLASSFPPEPSAAAAAMKLVALAQRFTGAPAFQVMTLTWAKSLLEQDPSTASGHPREWAAVLNNLGLGLRRQHKLADAMDNLARCEAILQALVKGGDEQSRPTLAKVLNSIGMVRSDQGDLDIATRHYEACRDIFQELLKQGKEEFRSDFAGVLNNLGRAYADQRNPDGAKKCYKKSLKIYQDFVDQGAVELRPQLGSVQYNLGKALSIQGELGKADEYYRKSEGIYRALIQQGEYIYRPQLANILHERGNALGQFARILHDQGNSSEQQSKLNEAIACFRECQGFFQEQADLGEEQFRPNLASVMDSLGQSLREQGQLEEAQVCFAKARALEK